MSQPCLSSQAEGQAVVLPSCLKSRLKFVLAIDLNGKTYSIGIRYIMPTAGAHVLINHFLEQRREELRTLLTGTICPSMLLHLNCVHGEQCAFLHIQSEGYENRRPWPSETFEDCRCSMSTYTNASAEKTGSAACGRDGLRLPIPVTSGTPQLLDASSSSTASSSSVGIGNVSHHPSLTPHGFILSPPLEPVQVVTLPAIASPYIPSALDFIPLHCRVPIQLELLQQGHAAHNPYAFNGFGPPL